MPTSVRLRRPRPVTTLFLFLAGSALLLIASSSLVWIAYLVDSGWYASLGVRRLLQVTLALSGLAGIILLSRGVADFREFCVITLNDTGEWVLTSCVGLTLGSIAAGSRCSVRIRPVRNFAGKTSPHLARLVVLSGRRVFRSVPARSEIVDGANRALCSGPGSMGPCGATIPPS